MQGSKDGSFQPSQDELLVLARTAAIRAGRLVRARRAVGVTVAGHKSSATDVVTAADRESEELIRALLQAARPTDGFLGEESANGASTPGTSGLTWVVDPIDGTVNYLYDRAAYAVSIAVVAGDPTPEAWHPVAGVVFNPVSGELFCATAGGGAWLERVPVIGSDTGDAAGDAIPEADARMPLIGPPKRDLSHSLLGTGFAYDPVRRGLQADALARIIRHVRDIRRAGSAALDLCALAAGELDCFYEQGLHPWDHAAGCLIAREAGLSVGGLRGAREGEPLVLAARPEVFAELEGLLGRYGISL